MLLAARRPQWVRQTVALVGSGDPAGASIPKPSGNNDGVSLQNTTTALISIDPRLDPSTKTCKITLSVVDLTGAYRTEVNGNGNTFVAAAADLAALINAWRDDINGSAPTNTIVTAAAEESIVGGGIDTLVITGQSADDYSLLIDTPAGSGVINGVYDASSGMANVFFTHRPFAPTTGDPVALWHLGNRAQYTLGVDNFMERFDVAGLDRGYVELFGVRGASGDDAIALNTFVYNVGVTFGPAVQETAT